MPPTTGRTGFESAAKRFAIGHESSVHVLAWFEKRVTSRLATPEEAEALNLNPGSAVLAVTRLAYAAGDVPVELNDIVLAGERYELVYELLAD